MSHYCPHHDPLIRAGIQTCQRCGRIAYPTDAAWVEEDKILASFPPICAHHNRPVAKVIDVTRMTSVPHDFDPERYTARRRCAAIAYSGQPCRSYAQPGSDYCYNHQPREAR